MMIDDDEPVDPLVDPFGAIDNDPLNHYKPNGYNQDSSSSDDENLSSFKIPPSLTIIPSSSAGNLKVHKIPAYSNSITITKVDRHKLKKPYLHKNGYSYDESDSYWHSSSKKSKKKDSKKKKKSKERFYDEEEDDEYNLANKVNNILKEHFVQTELSLRLNGSIDDFGSSKKKSKKSKSKNGKSIPDLIPYFAVPSHIDPSLCLVVEIDPSEFFPDEPMPREKVKKKKNNGVSEERTFECIICKKGFKCLRGLVTHKSVKHDIEDLSGYYPCEMCEEVFAFKRDLMNHYVTHQNSESRYPCPESDCNKTEPDLRSFMRHKRKIHPYLGTLGRTWFHTWGDSDSLEQNIK